MKRFHPVPRPQTLQHKALTALDERRFAPSSGRVITLRIARVLGMAEEARTALARLLALAQTRKIGVAGRFMPDDGVSAILADHGIAESVEEEDFFRFRSIVIPFVGVSTRRRSEWERAGYSLEDFTAPQVRRAQVALGLLRMEGAQALVIGRHDDPESEALAGGGPGTRVIEDTTDTARLAFAPAFGVVCQTTLSPRKVSWLVQQLRFRWRDARVTFLDTVCPAMAAREEALENALLTCDRVIVVGRPGEASSEALAETALRRGRAATVVRGVDDLRICDLSGRPRVALTAGAFAADETVHEVAAALSGS